MKRKELFEFEDFNWLPSIIRKSITNLIIVFHKMMGTSEVLSDLILGLKEKHDFSQIVDMGSGSGGPMLEVVEKLNEEKEQISLVLTDLHPSPQIVENVNNRKLPNVRYRESSLDATNIGTAPEGLKTMIASFHHMNPETAKNILQSAQSNKQPILIYELAKNNVPFIVWLLLLPLGFMILIVMCLVMTLFVRPVSISQFLFTYLIPVVPFVYAWDGQASLMRTYTFEDVEGLLADIKEEGYHWEIDDAKKKNGKKAGYYIMGYPTN